MKKVIDPLPGGVLRTGCETVSVRISRAGD